MRALNTLRNTMIIMNWIATGLFAYLAWHHSNIMFAVFCAFVAILIGLQTITSNIERRLRNAINQAFRETIEEHIQQQQREQA